MWAYYINATNRPKTSLVNFILHLLCKHAVSVTSWWIRFPFCSCPWQVACGGSSLWPSRLLEARRWLFWMNQQPGWTLTHAEGFGICCWNTAKVHATWSQTGNLEWSVFETSGSLYFVGWWFYYPADWHPSDGVFPDTHFHCLFISYLFYFNGCKRRRRSP